MTQIGKNIAYALSSNIIYALIVYFSYTWLAGYSLLLGYFGNLALIIMALVMDEGTLKMLRSKELVMSIKKEKQKDIELALRLLKFLFDGFVSFKTVLYTFYVFILIVSQIIDFYPSLINPALENFIHANSYSILLLIAFDQIIGQFSKDRGRIKEVSAEFVKNWAENQES